MTEIDLPEILGHVVTVETIGAKSNHTPRRQLMNRAINNKPAHIMNSS